MVLALLAWSAAAAAQGPPELRQVPVFPLETPGHQLQAGVYESLYPIDAAYLPQQLPAAAAAQPPGSLDAVVLTYLDLVLRGRFGEVPELFPSEADRSKVVEAARFYGAVFGALPGGVTRLRLDRVWHFGPFRVVLVEARGTGGAVRMVSVSLEQRGERFVRRDDWGRWQPVQSLFWYMTRNFDKGLVAGHRPRDLPIEVTLAVAEGDSYPLTVSATGTVHPPSEWLEVADGGGPATVAGAALAAFAAANTGDDPFVALWYGEERAKMAASAARGDGMLAGHRAALSGIAAVRPVVTLDLGNFAGYYYLRRGEPEVQALVLRRAEGRFWLTDELYTNLDVFLTSALFRDRIGERFAAAGGASP